MEAAEIILLVAVIALELVIIGNTKKGDERVMRRLIENGKINTAALEKAQLPLDELMSRARLAGYFNLADIDVAVMEPCGEISFLPKAMQRRLTPRDFNFAPVREGIPVKIIENGEILYDSLEAAGITEGELKTIIEARGRTLGNILLATITDSGRVDVFEMNN